MSPLGENPAVPTGTELIFECPPGYKFSHDWYAPTSIGMACTEFGIFAEPQWPKCIFRELG